MKSVIRWAIKNKPAMNTLMIAILVVGTASMFIMRREVFPGFELEYIVITVPYPGASPEEVEEGICQKIEEAVRATDGIKKIISVAREGAGTVLLELKSGEPNTQKILNKVRSDVDRIPSFPEMAEDPEVEQFLLRRPAIRVGVIGPESDNPEAERRLRDVAEEVRDELLQLPSVSQVEMVGVKDYQIDVEISEETLRKYGLTLQQVAQIIRRENIELPGGTMKTDSQEILLRGKNKRLLGHEIAKIPLVTQPDGVVLTVGDLGVVRDEFVDTTAIHRINGKPGMVIAVQKTAAEDLLEIVHEIKQFLGEAQGQPEEKPEGFFGRIKQSLAGGHLPSSYRLPYGYSLTTWDDNSVMVEDRINLLTRNGLQGLALVLVVLAVFLELRLAAWVAMGIPISILGGAAIMLGIDQTLNMLSLFAFLMVLGILVDDAIVVGENVYTHRQGGKGLIEAAVDGTCEVLPSVTASVSTTIIAFVPLLFVPGVIGKFIAIMPIAVIAMLLISLFECAFILPCHLVHQPHSHGRFERLRARAGRLRFLAPWSLVAIAIWGGVTWMLLRQSIPLYMKVGTSAALLVFALLPHLVYWARPFFALLGWIHDHVFNRVNARATRLLNFVIHRLYLPVLRRSLDNPSITLAAGLSILLLAIGLVQMGVVEFVFFPKLDSNTIAASITYPDGTPASVTAAATRRMEEAVQKINRNHSKPNEPFVQLIHRSVGQPSTLGGIRPGQSSEGSHVGGVGVEMVGTECRDVRSDEIADEWRELCGAFPGAENVTFGSAHVGPGGAAIEFRLLARPRDMNKLEEAIEKCKEKLATYKGVQDIVDDSQPGKWEFQVNVKDDAKSLGLTAADLAETIRAAYYGEEVMRLQRGRHEVKLMVRYPRNERRSLADFDEIRVRMQPSRASNQAKIALRNVTSPASAAGRPAERPLTELADVQVKRGYSSINRLDQLRSITITADVNKKAGGNAARIVGDMKKNFFPKLLKEYPGLRLNWEGQQQQTQESFLGLGIGLALALVVMFALLTFEFRSYLQPVLILAIVPFGFIGAVLGHFLMGLDLTIFSLFGLVALTGVVVNDSIVLIDFINRRVRSGIALGEALLDAGRRRFRPVMLTSLTTVAGLLPILLERSFQAQVLIPMATSLAFGLMFTTLIMLILVPTMYLVYVRLVVGDEARMLDSPELVAKEPATDFVGLEHVATPSEPVAQLEPSPVDTALLDPTETVAWGVRAQPVDDDSDADGDGQPDEEAVPQPQRQTWPPPSHLPRSGGGQD